MGDAGIAIIAVAVLYMLSKKNGGGFTLVDRTSTVNWTALSGIVDTPQEAEEIAGVKNGATPKIVIRGLKRGGTAPSPIIFPPTRPRPQVVTPEIIARFKRSEPIKVFSGWEEGKTPGGVTVPSGIKPIPVTAEILARYARKRN